MPHSLATENTTVTSICYPDRTQRTFRLPDASSAATTSAESFHDVESHTRRWLPELCQPEHAAESDFHHHSLVMEYASLARPPRARFPEFFVDVCSANGMSIGYVDGHGVAHADPFQAAPLLTRPVRFYALALDGVIRVYPHEDVVLVLVLMASNRSLSNYGEEDGESRRGSGSDWGVDEGNRSAGAGNNTGSASGSTEATHQQLQTADRDDAEDVITIFGFVIPIEGIYEGRFTKSAEYDHLVRAFAIKEQLVSAEEVAVMRDSEEGYLDQIAYDFVSGRIVLSGVGSKGVIILDFDELCVTGGI